AWTPACVCHSLPGLTHAPLLWRHLTRHLEMLLQGRQGLARKGFDIRVAPLVGLGREEPYGFLMIRDHVTRVLAVKTRALLLGERPCGLLMLFIDILGYGDVLGLR